MEAIDATLRRWRAEGTLLNPPASASDLARLAEVLATSLPEDVRYYFSLANGMLDAEQSDDSLTNFWPISRMLSEPWQPSGTDSRGDYRDLAFADVMINSWFICFRVRPRAGLSIHVEGALTEIPSLTAFFERYLSDRGSLSLL